MTMKKEINRTGYLYRVEMMEGTVKMDSSVSNDQIQYLNKTDVKSIYCIDAVTGRAVDSWKAE